MTTTLAYYPHKTAKARTGPSSIARLVVSELLPQIKPNRVLDYGCGYGVDVRYFRGLGVKAEGYDPYIPFGWSARQTGKFGLVILAFVLNVLHSIEERNTVVNRASSFLESDGYLLIATRTPAEIQRWAKLRNWQPHADGFWSSPRKGTFQKGLSKMEVISLAKKANLDESIISIKAPSSVTLALFQPRKIIGKKSTGSD